MLLWSGDPLLLQWLRSCWRYVDSEHGLPNYPVEVLSYCTPANDNRELGGEGAAISDASLVRALAFADLTCQEIARRLRITRTP